MGSNRMRLNSKVQCITYPEHLTSTTAVDIISDYDLVLDCTDHPTSRYLISDAAVLAGKPLVSASALQTEGQLLMLNNPPSKFDSSPSGPCYRCVFPKPPPPESVTSCGDGGILGPVVGVMGVLMALEAVKVITASAASVKELDIDQATDDSNRSSSMLIFSAFGSPPFRSIRLRGRRPNCTVCSATPSITKESLRSGSLDYARFCGLTHPVAIFSPVERIAARELSSSLQQKDAPILIDVRDTVQFDLCHLDRSINIPFHNISSLATITADSGEQADRSENNVLEMMAQRIQSHPKETPVYLICRFGNDSQLAVRKFKELNHPSFANRTIRDVQGGFQAWRREVDNTWPDY